MKGKFNGFYPFDSLARRQKNNPVLIGEAGVGKTAIVEVNFPFFKCKLAGISAKDCECRSSRVDSK